MTTYRMLFVALLAGFALSACGGKEEAKVDAAAPAAEQAAPAAEQQAAPAAEQAAPAAEQKPAN